jgi:hypothetical protein
MSNNNDSLSTMEHWYEYGGVWRWQNFEPASDEFQNKARGTMRLAPGDWTLWVSTLRAKDTTSSGLGWQMLQE